MKTRLVLTIIALSVLISAGSYAGEANDAQIKSELSNIVKSVYSVCQEAYNESPQLRDNIEMLREKFMNITVGRTGYVWVYPGKGADRGRYVVSRQGMRDGEDIWNSKVDGRFIVHSIVKKALATKDGSVDYEIYSWQNPGETKPRKKISAITYFKPWDWVIGAGAYEDEFNDLLVQKALSQTVKEIYSMCQNAYNESPQLRDNIKMLREKIMNITVGTTGYAWVLGGKGADRGHYIISRQGMRDGEDIWNSKDSDGRLIVRSNVEKALATKGGSVDYGIYPWQNPGETKPRKKISAITYFKPWDWVIGAGAYEDEFNDLLVQKALSQTVKEIYSMCQNAYNESPQLKDSIETLRKEIMGVVIGKTGYVWVDGGKGADRGHSIISKKGMRDGEDLWNSKDSDGRLFVHSIVKKALATKDGSVDYEVHSWQNPGETKPRRKISAVTYFKPWDWVIGAGAYED
ncbi:MAG: Cache 3/Cache 2 fusion domain-containing protein, partial [Deltaproteobacteria bacterium]|nr:Cache 3/Cache 2 fusion domain-containing protein [Deltaproteobacteria bacterium]